MRWFHVVLDLSQKVVRRATRRFVRPRQSEANTNTNAQASPPSRRYVVQGRDAMGRRRELPVIARSPEEAHAEWLRTEGPDVPVESIAWEIEGKGPGTFYVAQCRQWDERVRHALAARTANRSRTSRTVIASSGEEADQYVSDCWCKGQDGDGALEPIPELEEVELAPIEYQPAWVQRVANFTRVYPGDTGAVDRYHKMRPDRRVFPAHEARRREVMAQATMLMSPSAIERVQQRVAGKGRRVRRAPVKLQRNARTYVD